VDTLGVLVYMDAVKPKATVLSPPGRILRPREVTALTSLGRATLDRYSRAGHFPAPVSLGPRRIGWFESEVVAWLGHRPRTGREDG
jgi:prophage regulatory protein